MPPASLSVVAPPVAECRAATKVALSAIEKAAATGLMEPRDADEIAAFVEERATAYASSDPEVRRRGISRALACCEQMMMQISALLARSTATRDSAVPTLDKLLNSATHRFVALTEQHRLESLGPRRKIAVLAKGTVAITAEDST
jgi:hypothetical protein